MPRQIEERHDIGHDQGQLRARAGKRSSTTRGRDDGMNENQTHALTEHEVAARLGLSVATLRAWRLKRKGPRFVRFGRAVRYLPADLDQFVASSSVGIAADIVGEDAR